ncbi:MAG: metal ABC transporter permease [Candidatus Aminicenantes bacterium]|nr:metal ABC transporter permease [Candidatus Aminicenantes bacterium]NIM77965.1 metal ABC transporter permease [Candidatus Aminicenantes bacterium]NIN17294.1 metal ABC transporter permease [Candidatus Aminicenantes bacterium]NIN41185.1 metal ABC transporter permease [Candidatus Aminicenantes bacterium]NIN83962.1 metal ABC transporter permease [Candidatus Aminicenantes bacterium]
MIDILFSAFLLSLVLLGIHSYFGLEIIKRGIIFTDLAIGQMSALGAAAALLFFNGRFLYPISLVFALGAALLSSLAARREKHLEAFIGLLYAFGVSGVFILLSQSPHGMEDFQNLLAADILFTPMKKIIQVAILYFFLGLFIVFINKKTTGFVKDFLFFATFAFTVTSSVQLAGVFVVFSLLIGPAFVAIKIKKGKPVIIAWTAGLVINVIAIAVSYRFDLPTGYTIVLLHAFTAMMFSLFKQTASPP